MWTWSISAFGSKVGALAIIAAAALPTEEVAGDGTVTPRVALPGEQAQLDLAKAEITAAVQAVPDGSGVAVGVSGNATKYSANVRLINDPTENVRDLITALYNAKGAIERNPSALATIKQITSDVDAVIAAKTP